jgi:Holliday junction resolvase-like predicted endonuclease
VPKAIREGVDVRTLWKVGKTPIAVERGTLPDEKVLEDMLVANLRMLSPDWMVIGRQVFTGTGYIDILALARDGALVVIELKKSRTPRDVVSQVLDYVSWAAGLESESVAAIYHQQQGADLHKGFSNYFDVALDVDQLNTRQVAVIVASEPDATTERIVRYLSGQGVTVNFSTFEVFTEGTQQYLSPNWTIDMALTQANVATGKETVQWNGHYYASFGVEDGGRNWDDARKYGFFSAGGGVWYSGTLGLLEVDDIIWVQSPKHGYIGVGRVTSKVQPFENLIVRSEGLEKLLGECQLKGNYAHPAKVDDDTREHCVGVRWLHTENLSNAVKQVGFFGNQNSVCRPRAAKWPHTVSSLRTRWKVDVD